ncbi:Lrp/AsnC ligand binding domain-containing protein [Flavobacteriaceae bacterium]|jgi:Lrp/AsnC family transcriptional regulator for asnA, asnC and gidA|nr:winged helix-turn-helix transcriptional regulator [Flavobacteriaceae bacterium]MBT4313167.1 winged helix-turn-helix transcriptional regulator [Flavobacteriaceae bacterium]MBT5091210.1 winged helix-turn-helix transcriptional regulator [Flavobacteriaceae bacterium]MBT5446578.1 winged helix-turn-helix transcriptional regulator [Flavobacteriaceae bacterium]MBT5694262.1 winged helix-turn-helix transcriptional regulator [Flavobacteriaceae bacterium]|tara:strand:- start:1018 stop:1488 length:471 start_codon:yes stop_codon:yes gene_type:complete
MKISEQTVVIDGIDKIILKTLMNDARTPILAISKITGISGAAVHQRLKKLEKAEVISGSQIIINPKILGFKTVAFIGIYLDKAMRNPEAVKQLKSIPEVIECHYTTGNWSIFAKLLCKDNEHLMELLNKKIQSVEGVSRTETFISLQQQLNRQITL